MDETRRKEAEDRLIEALGKTGARDPRERYRKLLRELKLKSEAEYEQVVSAFQESVVERIVDGDADPLTAWLQFGTELAERLHPGRDVVIDETGRAETLTAPPSWGDLILHLPDDRRARGVVIELPPEPSLAQKASVDLLAQGSVRLADV